MYYDPRKKNHGLPHDPFTALVVPRPIGWISTLDTEGRVNLAPYSYFNALSGRPPFVMFSSTPAKHSQTNAEATGEFVANLASYEMREEVNATSEAVPAGVDEAALVGLEMVPSVAVRPPRVKRSLVALECVYNSSVALRPRDGSEMSTTVVLGEVVGIHIDDSLLVDGRVDFLRMRPLARLGYMDYGTIDTVFEMKRPGRH